MNRIAGSLLASLIALAIVLPAFAAPPPEDRATTTVEEQQAPAVPGQFLVKFRPGVAASVRQAAIIGQGGRVFDRITNLDIEAVTFPAAASAARADVAEAIIMRLRRNPNIEFVEPNYIYRSSYTPNDPASRQAVPLC